MEPTYGANVSLAICLWSMTSSASAFITATTRCQQPVGQSAFVHLTEIKDWL